MVKKSKLVIISSCICLVMVLGLFVLQFTPYWTFTGEECGEQTLSISSYVWFPNDDVQNEFEDYVKDEVFHDKTMKDNKVVNEIVMFPAFTFGFCALAFAVFLLKFKSAVAPSIATFVAGISGTIGYLLNPVLAISDAWTLHLIVSIATCVIGLGLLVYNVMTLVRNKKASTVA